MSHRATHLGWLDESQDCLHFADCTRQRLVRMHVSLQTRWLVTQNGVARLSGHIADHHADAAHSAKPLYWRCFQAHCLGGSNPITLAEPSLAETSQPGPSVPSMWTLPFCSSPGAGRLAR